MSFFSEASLAMIPSGYKTSKVYSAVPTTGDGDLTFTRSNDTATRVGPDGLIEKVRTNLYPRGSALLATGWTSVGATLTAGQTDPNGGTTALRVQLAAAQTPYAYIYQTFTGSAATYARSAYIKAASAQSIRITDPYSGAATTVNLTTNWQRFTSVGAGIAPDFGIQFDNNNDAAAKDFTIAFVQIETGDIATDYIATTSAAVSVGPVANVPRLDYLDSSSPRLLLEPQRTNLFQYSEQFDNAYWTKITNGSATAPSVTANYTTSPDGYQNADRIQFSRTGTTSTDFSLIATGNINLSSTGTATLYVKSLTSATQNLLLYWGGGEGTVVSVTTQWTRVTLSNLIVANQAILFGTRGGSGNYFNGGDATLDIAVWGAQLEAGAYATSYIPTLGAAVTRGADACSKTGISSLIGQTEGTLFVELEALSGANDSRQICINDGTTSNRVTMAFLDNGTQMQFVVQSGGSVVMNSTQTISGLTTGVKIAYAYKVNDFAVYVNGSLLATDTNGAVPISMSALNFDAADGSDKFFGKVSQNLLFTSRLSNDDLATLTTI